MSEERVLFEVERMLMDNVQILHLMKSDPGTLDFLFNLVSDMGHARLGIPLHQNVHKVVVEQGGDENCQRLLENIIRPAMYSIECASPDGTGAAVFIYRCFNAASIISLYDHHRMPVDDFRFKVDVARMARDVVGEWVDFLFQSLNSESTYYTCRSEGYCVCECRSYCFSSAFSTMGSITKNMVMMCTVVKILAFLVRGNMSPNPTLDEVTVV